MKLILKDYLCTMREKDELDSLLLDLLLLAGFNVNNVPKSGERQYGVDIIADKDGQAFLFVVKQKNITRETWDSDKNSVRQSLNEVLDFFAPNLLPKRFHKNAIKIIVVTNGSIDDAVRPNWEGYCRENETRGGRHYSFDFWGIDKLVNMAFDLAFNETLFPASMQSVLRKALYFLDENDVNNNYYESLIDSCIESLIALKESPKPKQKKCFTSFYMLINLIIQWAHQHQRNKIAIQISEYAMFKYWRYLLANNLFEKNPYMDQLMLLMKLYERCNERFFHVMISLARMKCELPFENVLEHRILLYEIIGFLSSYGYYLSSFDPRHSQRVINCLIQIMNENQSYKYPLYDKNICELSILFLSMHSNGRKQDIVLLIRAIIHGLMINHIQQEKTPSQNDTYEDALAIEFKKPHAHLVATVLYGGLIEWCCILGCEDEYNRLRDYLKKHFDKISVQIWHLNPDEELLLYEKNAVFEGGVSQHIDLSLDFASQSAVICNDALSSQVREFSFYEYSFPAIALITSRYYGYPVLPEFWRKEELLNYLGKDGSE